MAAEPFPDPPPPRDGGVELLQRLVRNAGACPPDVAALARALVTVTDTSIAGEAMPGAVLADRLVVLARIRTTLDGELARVAAAAETRDVLPHTPSTTLQRDGSWTKSDATALVTAARFAARHPDVSAAWRAGAVGTGVVATLARGLSGVTADAERQVVEAVIPRLGEFSVAGMRVLVARALDLLHPDHRDAAEQCDYDRRSVAFTAHGGMTMIAADLPVLEGTALITALDALAESLRTQGDGFTKAQRRADALITLITRAAAHGDLPATTAGLPVAVTVTMGAQDADRVATGQARHPVTDLTDTVQAGADPAGIPVAGGTTITLGQAATRFSLCSGAWTPVLLDDRHRVGTPISQTLVDSRCQPLAVGRAHRLATTAQRVALAVRDGGCVLCERPAGECQTHHVTAWADGGATDLGNLSLLCWVHHRQVDLGRWVLERNPDPGGPYWQARATPRHRWRPRAEQTES